MSITDDVSGYYDGVFKAADMRLIRRHCTALLQGTRKLIDRERARQSKTRPFREGMNLIYEEMINFYNRIRHACMTRDHVTALYAAAELQQEFEGCISGTGVAVTEFAGMDDLQRYLAAIGTKPAAS
jgi:hypothetical protein